MKLGRTLRVLGEAAAIAVGVFLSLWADQWRQDRSAAAEGRSSLVRIATELANDTIQLRRIDDQALRGLAAIDSILNADPLASSTSALLERNLPWVMHSNLLDPSLNEFDALRSSGRLGLITHAEILNRLTRYAGTLQSGATMQDLDLTQAHAVAELIYPDIEMPRSQFVTGLTEGPRFPTPAVAPSATERLVDPVFVNEMTYLGLVRTLVTSIVESASTQAAELLVLIDQRLDQ